MEKAIDMQLINYLEHSKLLMTDSIASDLDNPHAWCSFFHVLRKLEFSQIGQSTPPSLLQNEKERYLRYWQTNKPLPLINLLMAILFIKFYHQNQTLHVIMVLTSILYTQ